jgi:hypothetical protein
LIEQNDEWLVCRRYLSDESMRLILCVDEDAEISLPHIPEDQEVPQHSPHEQHSTSSYTTLRDLTWLDRRVPILAQSDTLCLALATLSFEAAVPIDNAGCVRMARDPQ